MHHVVIFILFFVIVLCVFGLWSFFRWIFDRPIIPTLEFRKRTKNYYATNTKLKFKAFITCVNTDPDNWSWDNEAPRYYHDYTTHYVWFKSWLDYKLASKWFHRKEAKRLVQNNNLEEVKNTIEFMSAIRQAAAEAQQVAENKMTKSAQEIQAILERLQREESHK